jgi:CHAD domain-containing protein
MARARDIDGLDAATPFVEAARRIVAVRAEEVFEHAEGVLDTREIERVHDMRVATRRLRAVLEIFGPAFPKGEVRPILHDVKALADALGARRDPDVAIAGLERFAAEAPRADGPGAESLIAALRAEQDAGNEILAAALERARDGDLQERLEDLVGEARG